MYKIQWIMCITTWKHYKRKRSRGRLTRQWRDGLDEYWKGIIWQRIAQDRQMWKQHVDAYALSWDSVAVHIDVRRNINSVTEDWMMRM